MKALRFALLLAVVCSAAPALGQSVLYWHPASGSNSDIDGMVSDMANSGASVASTNDEGLFVKLLVNGPWDLVLVADQTLDTYNEDVWNYLTAGNTIFVLTSLTSDDVLIEIATGGSRNMQQAFVRDIPGTIVCFGIWFDCRFNLIGGCIATTPPLTQARVDCDHACDVALRDCLAA